MFVRVGWRGSARCSIDDGGFDRDRGGINVFCVSSILDAQSTKLVLN